MSSSSSSTSDWLPPSPEELQAMLPQYEISEIIGRGGMGAVYKGRQAKLNRTVAIKLLCPNRVERDSLPSGSPEGVSAGAAGAKQTFTQGPDELNFAKRFEQEAQAMANLDHPAIISVHDFGETANGQLYFVMEFVDGMDVHQYLQHHGGKLPQESALSITAHVLDALDYAHSHGIAHRDIKPANILLNQEGRVKIADFGLAKKFGDAADKSAPALTISNVAVGTPDFVAPEALDSDQTPDHRADLYAVGVMLYQMLTGKLPRGNFKGPSELDAEIDPRLDEIVSQAMASDPDHRYQSAAAVRADLDLVLSQPLARVQAGERSGAVAAAVPVTTSLKAGKAVKTKSQMPMIAGIAAAAVLVVGLIVMATQGEKEAERAPNTPVLTETAAIASSTKEKTDEVAKTPIAPNPEVVSRESLSDPKPALPSVAEAKKSDPPGKPTAAPAPQVPEPPAPVEPAPVEPAPVVASAPPTPPTAESPLPTESPNEEPSTRNEELLSIPGLQSRLDGYLAARRTQLTELAKKYGRGLDSRLGQAADAGDLKTASAYSDEKARVEALVKTLATPPLDPVAAVVAPIALPDLAAGSPETLTTLRQTWTAESTKIRSTLDAALQQSLQALEVELTKARDLETAKTVLAWRESLAKPTPAAAAEKPVAGLSEAGPATPATLMPAAKGDLPRATKDAPFENSLGMKFVPVPGTDVLFCIHEVRWKDYEEYAKKAKESVDGGWKTQTSDGFEIQKDADDHPVTWVNWEDAQKFCAWLSEKEGKTYRMPTDQEWSHAVGIGREEDWKDDTTPATVFQVPDVFTWGDEWPPPVGAGNYSDASRQAKAPRDGAKYLDGYDDTFPTTAPVMSFAANKLGLYDLGGNVWEWCDDWYSGEQKECVLRGGSWGNLERGNLLSSYRVRDTPEARSNYNGFRVILETTAKTASSPTPPAPPLANRPSAPDPALARATKDAPFENSLGMKFVPVPGTEVLFCIHETRYRDYEEYAKKAKESVEGSWKFQTNDGFEIKTDEKDHPVTRVSWDDAQKFCAWLSEKEGKTYRLPTDQEWSLAVGIGREEDWKSDTTPATVFKVPDEFPWDDEWPPPKGAGNYSDESRRAKAPRDDAKYVEGGYDDGFPTTAPVMSFDANKLGLFDLGGNVWEWCEDWYSNEEKVRVLRGASWYDLARSYLISSGRYLRPPETRSNDGGFRVVLVSSAPAPIGAAPPVSRPAPLPMAPDPALPRATKDTPFENSLGMKFVPVPGTDVLFCIHEVRFKDYEEYAKKAKETVDGGWKSQTNDGFEIKQDAENHPVTMVNWDDTQKFCAWLSEKEGKTYRLPTDQEWSHAVGIGREEKWKADTTPATVFQVPDEFPWGDEWPPPAGAGNYSDASRQAKAPLDDAKYVEGGYDDGFPMTAPVMSFEANKLGLYDLGGNVWEWCNDWYSVEQNDRVLRGGSWNRNERGTLLSSGRYRNSPDFRINTYGFRVVLVSSGG